MAKKNEFMAADEQVEVTSISTRVPDIRIEGPSLRFDVITIAGLIIAVGLIVSALIVGGSPQAFVNPAALMIVLGGTMAVTAISFMPEDLARLGGVVFETIKYPVRSPSAVAMEMMDLAVVARQKGLLAVSEFEAELRKDSIIRDAFIHLIDGFDPQKVIMILQQDLDSNIEQSRKSADILKRAAEVAPAMGLIGTLVGLVQMLSVLKDPDSIGPAMAIALLTTFYGALLGTVLIAPLAAKIERKSKQDALIRQLVLATVVSVANKDNPRQLEIELNALLPANQRIVYFA
ncbi:MAG: biopolymer transporter ExbB [Micavibrio sp.]|nr:biopolymer transporter ExbB [Micavibrio sp.]